MTFQQELQSWLSPTSLTTSPAPELGSKAPSSEPLPFPSKDGKRTIVTFLRHCGCPFAEKNFLSLRTLASQHANAINFVAISHSSQSSTEKWLSAIGGAGDVQVIVDSERAVYAKWGLGVSSAWHVLNPWSMWEVYKLGKGEGIWNRPTESGSRWQTSGSWGIDGEGVVRWGEVARAADDIADFEEGVKVLLEEQK
ncbi:uncharacterized protein LY89DRAFT_704959 [Mollisia scopiformis]|uniref:Uncharacterized protein n=1 Tax=Mollisia scopiformis TaxID=149040 RepID=A0A194XLE8_MOLSC|nr:uncharacterized protein LY89DRAFT_704959 [Mollisia scopiformis]KUJ21003.1 hypothetical protein LY89DRAFT_704959 [Mollisia scopiformis]